MRTIKFQVTEQRIKNIDTVAFVYGGTNNYLKFEFAFDDNWYECAKVISFGNDKCVMKIDNNCCLVPQEAFDKNKLTFYILGGRKNGYRIRTEPFSIKLLG